MLSFALLLTSCPNQISQDILLQAKDEIGPMITILLPEEGSSYAAMVVISGIVTDLSSISGEGGGIENLSYTVLNTAIGGNVQLEGDGSFSFYFQTTGLSGSVVVSVEAEDWNGNTGSVLLTLKDEGAIPTFTADPGNGMVTLTWDPVPFAESYTIYYEESDIIPNEEYSPSIPDAVSPCPISDLTNGEMHVFLLQAQSSTGEDNWSNIVRAIPLSSADLSPILTPRFDGVLTEWEPVPATDRYEVWRSQSPDSGFNNVSGVIQKTSFLDKSVEPGEYYYYSVKPAYYCDVLSDAAAATRRIFPSGSERSAGFCATPGYSENVAVSGSYAYVADGDEGGLRIIDVSDPDNPYEVGYFDPVDFGWVQEVDVCDNYAYLANWDGLYVVDVSPAWDDDPGTVPVQTAFLATAYGLEDVKVAGNYAYVAGGMKLHIIDITPAWDGDPGTVPFEVGSYDTTHAWAVSVSGEHAFVAAGGGGLQIINVSGAWDDNPSTIIYEAGRCLISGDLTIQAYDVAVAFNGSAKYAYATSMDEPNFFQGLAVFDVTSALNVQQGDPAVTIYAAGTFPLIGDAYGVEARWPYVYLTEAIIWEEDAGGLYILDASVPNSPKEVDFYRVVDGIKDVAISGYYAYMVREYWGLYIANIAHPGAPVEVASYNPGGYANSVTMLSNYAYVTNNAGVTVVDVSPAWDGNPETDPVQAGYFDMSDMSPSDIVVRGPYAYVADYDTTLRILDVSPAWDGDPSTDLDEVGFYETPFSWPIFLQGIALQGPYAYCINLDDQRFMVFDISDPETPREIGSCNVPDRPWNVTVRGGYAFVADHYEGGLRIIDVSNPAAPFEIGHYPPTPPVSGYYARDVAVSGNYAYVAASSYGLSIIDISDPSSPSEVGFYDTAGYAYGIAVNGSFAYVADYSNGFLVFDIEDPSSPELVGSHPTNDQARDVFVSGEYAYVADNSQGLHIFDLWPFE